MLYSKPYNYYADRDDQNLGAKLRHSFKLGLQTGLAFGFIEISAFRRPKNFAMLIVPYAKWSFLGGVALSIQAAVTYGVAKQQNYDGPLNHFLGGIGPALILLPWLRTPYSFCMTYLLTGSWAAYQKYKMMNFNTTELFEDAFRLGVGGLYQGQHSIEKPIRRYLFQRDDPGKREELHPEY